MSTNPPPGAQASLSSTGRRAVDITVTLLADLGHEILEVTLDYGLGSLWSFRSADVVLTPLCGSLAPRIDQCPKRGALRSLRVSNTSAWLVPWNVIGQPAITVPIGTDHDNLPNAIQLAGRARDEMTLLALASQIEAAHPFPRWSPTAARSAD